MQRNPGPLSIRNLERYRGNWDPFCKGIQDPSANKSGSPPGFLLTSAHLKENSNKYRATTLLATLSLIRNWSIQYVPEVFAYFYSNLLNKMDQDFLCTLNKNIIKFCVCEMVKFCVEVRCWLLLQDYKAKSFRPNLSLRQTYRVVYSAGMAVGYEKIAS